MKKPTVTEKVPFDDRKQVRLDEATHKDLVKFAKANGYVVHRLATILIRDGLERRQLATSA